MSRVLINTERSSGVLVKNSRLWYQLSRTAAPYHCHHCALAVAAAIHPMSSEWPRAQAPKSRSATQQQQQQQQQQKRHEHSRDDARGQARRGPPSRRADSYDAPASAPALVDGSMSLHDDQQQQQHRFEVLMSEVRDGGRLESCVAVSTHSERGFN